MAYCPNIVNSHARQVALSAHQQIAALHGPDQHETGNFIIAKRESWREHPWQEKAWGVGCTAAAASELQYDERDVYVSMASFLGNRRRNERLARIGCVWVDLDYHRRSGLRDKAAEDVFQLVTYALKDSNIPWPAWGMATGRGLCLVWLHTWIPKAALPRWAAIQKCLIEALRDFGADKNASDAARVFRVAGTRNSRATGNPLVRAVYVDGDPDTLRARAWDFDTLALEILPLDRAELHSLQAERAKRLADKNSEKSYRPATNLSWATYGEAILVDLHRLRLYRYGDGLLPAGDRDEWLFVAACAMAYFCPPSVLKKKVVALAGLVSGWSAREATSNMGTVIRRAVAAAKGRKVLGLDGLQRDPRYQLRSATIIERLSISSNEMRAAELRVLVTADRRREINTARTRAARHARGATPRETVERNRNALGVRAWSRHQQGEKISDIAISEGVSCSHVSKAMKEVREKKQQNQGVSSSSRLIVAKPEYRPRQSGKTDFPKPPVQARPGPSVGRGASDRRRGSAAWSGQISGQYLTALPSSHIKPWARRRGAGRGQQRSADQAPVVCLSYSEHVALAALHRSRL